MKNTETARRRKANAALAKLTSNRYFDSLPLHEVGAILTENGFNDEAVHGVFCGREGRFNEQVGDKTWILITWYKMPVTGQYEVVSYLS